MQNDFLLIGIDGGASKVSGWEVIINENDKSFYLGNGHSERVYSRIPGFIPNFKAVELMKQLAERDACKINPTDAELQQAAVYVEACAQVIEELVEKSNQKRILAGLGMPGLKTEDKRGIAMIANGPRMIHFADQLENRIQKGQIEFIRPIHKLGSDADYCGIGENFSEDGLFYDVANGYYLGGGTGAADAMKLDGKLIAFDVVKDWIAKSWEMQNINEQSMEKFASARGMRNIYSELSGKSITELHEQKIYPLDIANMAKKGDNIAKKTFSLISDNLALLFYERITTLFAGWQDLFSFINPNKPELLKDHPFKKSLFDRIIIGQRLGQLFESEAGSVILKLPVLKKLDKLIQRSKVLDDAAKKHYKNLDCIIQTSKLRAAPALGAGIDAYINWKQ